MRIVRPADGSLVIRVRPGFELLLALAIPLPLWKLLAEGPYPLSELPLLLLASLIAAFALSLFAEVSDFTFDPVRTELRWSRKTFWRREAGRVPLRDILGVEVNAHRASGEDYDLRKVVLSLRGGSLALTRYSSTGRSSEKAAQAIREFLAARGLPEPRGAVDEFKRAVSGFHQDGEGQWVAELECGHQRHVRHQPPWFNRPWVVTEAGRQDAIGKLLVCKECETAATPDRR